MNLSAHFTLAELIRSQTAIRNGINNTPDDRTIQELRRLCATVLEPVRELLDVPLQISSGYRCPRLNALVGSTAKHSAHLDGRAADFVPMGMDLREAFDAIRSAPGLPIDQIIIECGEWIHVAIPALGQIPRRQALIARCASGKWVYTPIPHERPLP